MNVVVLGSSGQLASHLKEWLPHANFLSRAEVDLADGDALERTLRAARPTHIINAAAYTAVDRAESEPALAWAVNAEAPAAMARVANALDIPLVHISTDYVFDGRQSTPWRPDDAVNPINVYGRTKLAGEIAVKTLCRRHWILRTSWVFSEYGANFLKTMVRLAGERAELRVVEDQRGRPTYAGDLARLAVKLVEDGEARCAYGLYHATGGPVVSWRDFAETIVDVGTNAGVVPRRIPVIGIPSSDYPTPAMRPRNSALEPSEALAWSDELRFDWQAAVRRVIDKLAQSKAE